MRGNRGGRRAKRREMRGRREILLEEGGEREKEGKRQREVSEAFRSRTNTPLAEVFLCR